LIDGHGWRWSAASITACRFETARANLYGSYEIAGFPLSNSAHFRPLDPDIVSATIPAFFIGRNQDGFWVARDVKGQTGGIFLREKSAVSFARTSSRTAGCVTIFLSKTIELDLENDGNPLVLSLSWLMRRTKRPRHRIAAFIGRMMGR